MSRSEKAMQAVRKMLEANPDAETQELFERAKKADESIADLSLRQFNARYPLQVKRQKRAKEDGGKAKAKRSKKRKRTKAEAADVNRQAIRKGLLRFATDVAAAEDKAELIDVLRSVDEYVNDVVGDLDL